MRRIAPLVICVPLVALCLDSSLEAVGPPNSYAERVEPIVRKIVAEAAVPGLAIGIVEDGRLGYAKGFGVMRMGEPQKPVTPETLFHMASITKPFVATAVLQLVEQGKVDLDAPVTKYLPYFRLKDARYRSITVRQMLTHTSAMLDVDDYAWDKPEYDDGALERYVRSLADKQLLRDPGAKFTYSNMAFEVLGDLVAKVSGQSFEDYVDSHIFKPLDMKSSTLLFKAADPLKLAAGHTRKKDHTVVVVAHYPYNRAHTPSSNLHSNVVDMSRWMLANLNRGELDGRRILKSSSFDLLWKPAAEVEHHGIGINHVGLSWFLGERNGDRLVTHGGADDGFKTYLALAPDRRLGVVIMANSDQMRLAMFQEIVDAVLKHPVNVK